MGKLFRFIKPALLCGWNIIYCYFSFMRPGSKKHCKIPLEKRYKECHSLLKQVSKSLGAVFFSEGLENLSDGGPYFLVSNHLSDSDPFPFLSLIDKPTTFIAKKEVSTFPFVYKALLAIEGKIMDRENLRQSLNILREVQHDLEDQQDKNWVIFPEGTRNKNPLNNLMEFKGGSFKPATLSKTTIVPVAIYGTQNLLRSKPIYKKYPIFIKVLKPITYEEYKDIPTNDLAEYCRKEIQKVVTYELRPKYIEAMKKYNGKRFKGI